MAPKINGRLHTRLRDLLGDGEYHLSSAQRTGLIGATDTSLHYHSSDRALGNATGTLGIANGGSGLTATPTNGQLLIGNGSGFTLAALTAGTNITITNSDGGISIAASGGSSGTIVRRYLEGSCFPTVLMYYRVAASGTISEVRATLGALPTGANFIVDIRKNGTASGNTILSSTISITTGQSASNGVYTSTGTISSSSVSAGDVLYVVITQVGSTLPGQDLEASITIS